MKKHRALLAILAMLLLVGMLGACAAPAAPAAATEAPAAEAATTDAAATDGTYPVIRMAYTRIFATDSEAKIEAALNEIMRKEAGAETQEGHRHPQEERRLRGPGHQGLRRDRRRASAPQVPDPHL